jgi:hypothetical protein
MTPQEEQMDMLRILIKYLLFDVEATRRERDILAERLRRYEDEGRAR